MRNDATTSKTTIDFTRKKRNLSNCSYFTLLLFSLAGSQFFLKRQIPGKQVQFPITIQARLKQVQRFFSFCYIGFFGEKERLVAVSSLQVARIGRFRHILCIHVSLYVYVCGWFDISRRVSHVFFSFLFAGRLGFPLPGSATALGHVRTSPYLRIPNHRAREFWPENRIHMSFSYQVFRSFFVDASWDEFAADSRLILKSSFIRVAVRAFSGLLGCIRISGQC